MVFYTGKHLLTFVDNHDVSRIASTLTNKAHLPLIYALMFGMPGIPCIYYGSEWGCEAVKGSGNDNILRPSFDKPEYNELTYTISSLGQMYHNSRALSYGDYTRKYSPTDNMYSKGKLMEKKCLSQLMQMRMSTQRTLIQNVQMHLIL